MVSPALPLDACKEWQAAAVPMTRGAPVLGWGVWRSSCAQTGSLKELLCSDREFQHKGSADRTAGHRGKTAKNNPKP